MTKYVVKLLAGRRDLSNVPKQLSFMDTDAATKPKKEILYM